MTLAPIVLFVYNRLDHTKETIQALLQNGLASQSELFIYSDAAKNKEDLLKVQEVREYIQSIQGFKKISIILRDKNWGLADSIIDGVTNIVNQYGKIIVLEDDIVVSPVFLDYMNDALNRYQNESKVWSISAWNYPIDFGDLPYDTFFWRSPHCWGWATWKNRWEYYKRDISWVKKNFTPQEIKEINLNSPADFWKQFQLNQTNKIKTWAIFWYLTAYKQQGLTLMPKKTLITQVGFDQNGTNCHNAEHPFANQQYCTIAPQTFPPKIEEEPKALQLIRNFYIKNHKNILIRAINKASRILFKRNLFK